MNPPIRVWYMGEFDIKEITDNRDYMALYPIAGECEFLVLHEEMANHGPYGIIVIGSDYKRCEEYMFIRRQELEKVS